MDVIGSYKCKQYLGNRAKGPFGTKFEGLLSY